MAQRLGIAAARLGDPGVLLLDEPAEATASGGSLEDAFFSLAGESMAFRAQGS
jgi:ABC-type nitrate/sulfonate/bicarbonate transport system ATPase subunit